MLADLTVQRDGTHRECPGMSAIVLRALMPFSANEYESGGVGPLLGRYLSKGEPWGFTRISRE
jgi:hypothetical protein